VFTVLPQPPDPCYRHQWTAPTQTSDIRDRHLVHQLTSFLWCWCQKS